MANYYDIGDVVVLETAAPFTDADGTPIDADTIVCQVRRFARVGDTTDPAAETLTTTHDGTGLYSATYTPAEWGMYGYRFALIGPDNTQAAEEAVFIVRYSYFEGA